VRKIKLHEVDCDRTTYCGPTAISAVTGRCVKRVVKDAVNWRRKRLREQVSPQEYARRRNVGRFNRVKSMSTWETMLILTKYGYGMVADPPSTFSGKRFHDWHFEQKVFAKDDVFMVVAHNHWIVVQGWSLVDAMSSQGSIQPVGKYSRPRAVVTEVYRVVRLRRGASAASAS
jgi:hypothetical protein